MDDSIDKTVKVVAVIVVASLVMLVCFIGGGASGIGGLVWLSQIPEDVALEIVTPAEVEMGKDATIEVTITNNSTTSHTLSNINISTGYVDGIAISSSTPSFDTTSEFDSYGITYQTYDFSQEIAPGESFTVTFKGRAMTEGNHAGEIDVCLGFSCFNNILQTIVR